MTSHTLCRSIDCFLCRQSSIRMDQVLRGVPKVCFSHKCWREEHKGWRFQEPLRMKRSRTPDSRSLQRRSTTPCRSRRLLSASVCRVKSPSCMCGVCIRLQCALLKWPLVAAERDGEDRSGCTPLRCLNRRGGGRLTVMDGNHAGRLKLRKVQAEFVLHPGESSCSQAVSSNVFGVDGGKLGNARLGRWFRACRATAERRTSRLTLQLLKTLHTPEHQNISLELTVLQSQHKTIAAKAHKSPGSHQTEGRSGTCELEKR